MSGTYRLPDGIRFVVLDADGTLCRTIKGHPFRHGAADWELIPGRKDAIDHWRSKGVEFAIATNQGGVAFGLLAKHEIERELWNLAEMLGIPAGLVFECYTHPQARYDQYRVPDDPNRKPNPGMVIMAMAAAGFEPAETLVVGDRPEDRGAAERAGCAFADASEFFCGWDPDQDAPKEAP
jgi:D-glycero-D-manno-heptose 1,7-bisphosphate phosphatase